MEDRVKKTAARRHNIEESINRRPERRDQHTDARIDEGDRKEYKGRHHEEMRNGKTQKWNILEHDAKENISNQKQST